MMKVSRFVLLFTYLFISIDTQNVEANSNSLHGILDFQFVTIPAGSFIMGADNGYSDNMPAHKVIISSDFQISKYEITQAQWYAVMQTRPWRKENGSLRDFVKEGDAYPVSYVNWFEVQEFLTGLNKKAKCSNCYRLPTEAEWEYAARAGTKTDYFFETSGELDDYAWYYNNTWLAKEDDGDQKFPHMVGSKKANSFGIHDMYGNVWEWCQDYYIFSAGYVNSPTNDPVRNSLSDPNSKKTYRVIRGGGFFNKTSDISSVFRQNSFPKGKSVMGGFRIIKSSGE